MLMMAVVAALRRVPWTPWRQPRSAWVRVTSKGRTMDKYKEGNEAGQ